MWESFSEQPLRDEKKSTLYKKGKTFHIMKIFYQLTQSICMTSVNSLKGLLARITPGLLSVFILQENYSDRKTNLIIGILISTNFYCIAQKYNVFLFRMIPILSTEHLFSIYILISLQNILLLQKLSYCSQSMQFCLPYSHCF